MADRMTPIHSGYSIINASFSGTATAKLGCWMEYKVVSQSVENNTSTIRFYIFIANVAAQGGCHIYCNNYDQTNCGSMTVKANGSTIYTRQKRGFATDLIPTASDYTTQYETPYGSAEDTKFLTVMTDNADTEAAGYGACVIQHNADGTGSVTLTTANMPSHNHSLSSGTATAAESAAHTHQAAAGTYKVGSGSGSNYKYLTNDGTTGPETTGSGGGHTHNVTLSGSTGSKGSGTAHSNMQPHITCFFYKRTA
ncbi:MAG: hypothetical protein IIZ73_10410 [Ruminococcus sp.]|nr:hypothetical protein [Ruminococcus sp.]